MKKFVELRIARSEHPIIIPYHPIKRDDGENYGYKSLIKNPELIDEIPEIKDEPYLKDFVLKINQGGVFETVRILHWTDEQNGKTRFCVCLGFIFSNREFFQNKQNCWLLADSILDSMYNNDTTQKNSMLIEIAPASLIDERIDGWIMDIYLQGIGSTPNDAKSDLMGFIDANLRETLACSV